MKHPSKLFLILALLLSFALVVTACGGGAEPTTEAPAQTEAEAPAETEAEAPAKEGGFVIGVSNTLVGNGWREQMICAIKAEATATGLVDRVIVVTDEQSHDGIAAPWVPRSYVVNVAPYQPGVGYRNGWNHIDGWSERVLDYIAETERAVD